MTLIKNDFSLFYRFGYQITKITDLKCNKDVCHDKFQILIQNNEEKKVIHYNKNRPTDNHLFLLYRGSSIDHVDSFFFGTFNLLPPKKDHFT